jgi:DNA anti-recombination protein RmuC
MEDLNTSPETATATLPDQGSVPAPPEPSSPAKGPDDSAGSLEKVRDILFGVQMREVDRRFSQVEERMAREAADLREDLRRRLNALEVFVKSEVESLNSRLRAEHETRSGVAGALGRDLTALAATLERRASAIDDQIDQRQRDMRQQMLDQHKRLSDDLAQKAQDLLAALAREAGALRHAKTDRATLAAMLAEMAGRLTEGLEGPGGRGPARE